MKPKETKATMNETVALSVTPTATVANPPVAAPAKGKGKSAAPTFALAPEPVWLLDSVPAVKDDAGPLALVEATLAAARAFCPASAGLPAVAKLASAVGRALGEAKRKAGLTARGGKVSTSATFVWKDIAGEAGLSQLHVAWLSAGSGLVGLASALRKARNAGK